MALLRRLVVLVALAASAVPVAAQSFANEPITLAEISRRSVEAKYSRADPVWRERARAARSYPLTVTSVGTGVQVAHALKGPGPQGVIDVEARVIVPKARIAQAILRNLPLVGTAIAIAEILDAARVAEGPGDTILMDPGEAQQTVDGFCSAANLNAAGNPALCAPTRQAVAQKYADWLNDTGYADNTGHTCTVSNPCIEAVFGLGTEGTGGNWRVSRNISTFDGTNSGGSYVQNWYQVNTGAFPITICPSGGAIAWWDSALCETEPAEWEVVDEAEAQARVEPKIISPVETFNDLDGAGAPVEGGIPMPTGPSAIHGGRETTTHPDGSTTVRDEWHDLRYGTVPGLTGESVPGYDWKDRIEERTYPPGSTIPEPGDPGAPPGTIIEDPENPLEDLITCGLPYTPPCKIDEAGTPAPVGADEYGEPDDLLGPIRDLWTDPPIAEVGWSWTFALPTGCSPIPLTAFAPFIDAVDICPWQPMIHDLVSLLWIGGTIWTLIAMITRTVGAT